MTPATESTSPQEPRLDYPSFLPPMLVKELRQLLRTKGFIVVFLGVHALMTLALLLALLDDDSRASNVYGMFNGFFWGLMTLVLLIITPMRGVNSLSTEIETRSIDLLLLTQLSARRIVLGKWGSLLGTGYLLALSLLPYGVLRYFFGSVDLLQDIYLLLGMLMVSAMLTALSIWTSGLAKVVRFLVPIFVIVALQTSVFRFITMRTIAGAPGVSSPWAGMQGTDFLFVGMCLLFLLLFFLLQAARRLNPPANNDAPLLRALPVIGVLLAVGMMLFGHDRGPMALAFSFMMIASAIELSHDSEVMPVHWRPWLARAPFFRWVGYCCLPGWASAALFAAGGLGLFAIAGIYPPLRIHGGLIAFSTYTWFLALAWIALVSPAVLLAILPGSARRWGGAGAYFVMQGMMGILAIFAANVSVSLVTLKTSLTVIGNILPISSFWLTATKLPQTGAAPEYIVGQAIMMAGVIMVAWVQAKPTFSMLRKITLREGPPPEPLKLEKKR